MRAAACVARRSLVCPTNSGSATKQDTMAQPPAIRSSRVICAALRIPASSPCAFTPLRIAAQNPASWVPPSGVGTVLQ